MSTFLRSILSLVTGSLVLGAATRAEAQCCQGYSIATACSGVTLTKSRWCIQDSVPTGQKALPAAFCAYGDEVVTTLESLFGIQAKDVFEFELDSQTGGAHTGTSCGHLGDGVAYDGFSGNAYGATGFWGYLLSLHEAINDWTGMSSSGWPTDFWADHQSAFPNVMDFHVMNTLGTAENDQNLIKAAAAQKKRFYPGGDTADAKVVALDNVFAAMPNGDGYAGFSELFALQSGDGVKWDGLGVPNPDVKRTEYVVAYMSLAARQKVLPSLQGPGANGGGNICNGTPDGNDADKPYTCDEGHIDAIANAHCAIAANGKPSKDLTALRGGNYAGVGTGPCGAPCPAECACDGRSHCVAAWLAESPSDAGTGDATASGGASNAGGASSGAGGASGAANSGASTGGSGAASSGGSVSGGSGNVSGRSGGGGARPGGAASGGTGVAGTEPDAGASSSAHDASGCGCRVEGPSRPRNGVLAVTSLAALAVLRRRRRRQAC